MANLIQTLRTSFDKHAQYRRTLKEIRSLSMDTRIDLDIAGIEAQVARKAVYG